MEREMQEAGAKRKQIAERKGQYHHGVPVIIVIVDGLLATASIHSYSTLGGVVIVV
jgi:hypothetical protein